MDPTDEEQASTSRRWWPAALASAAVAAGVAVHNVREVGRVRQRARQVHVDLDHRATVGYGLGDPLRLVVLGDSSGAGYGLDDPAVALPRQVATRLSKAAGRPVGVTCLAVDGARTADVVVRQAPHVRRLRPDAVVVVVGVNDAIGRTRRADVVAGTARLAGAIERAAPEAAVAFVGCPNLRYAPGLPAPLDRLVGLACRRVAGAQRVALTGHPVEHVDLYGPLEPGDFGPDGFHPGAEGCARIAERVVDAIVSRETLWTSD